VPDDDDDDDDDAQRIHDRDTDKQIFNVKRNKLTIVVYDLLC
jgi:myo-inositol-hexaphosphate 3-phosphohydrolase